MPAAQTEPHREPHPCPLPEHWLRGIAADAAAPPEVLVRLLDPAARAAWTILCEERDLPPAVVEAVLAHPERRIRRAFAHNPHADPGLSAACLHELLDLIGVPGGPAVAHGTLDSEDNSPVT